jgi:hypothetical protein
MLVKSTDAGEHKMTNAQLKTENERMRAAVAQMRKELVAWGSYCLNEAEHSAAVGAKEAQFASTVTAAAIDGALKMLNSNFSRFEA